MRTSSVVTNSENFFFSSASKHHISTRLSCESRLPDDRWNKSVNGRWTCHNSNVSRLQPT